MLSFALAHSNRDWDEYLKQKDEIIWKWIDKEEHGNLYENESDCGKHGDNENADKS